MRNLNTIWPWLFEGRDKSRFKTVLDSLRTIVEIVAIAVAGWWAWEHFERTEAPALRNNLKIEASLKWFDAARSDYCWGQVTLGIENASKSSVEIGKVVREAWHFKLPETQKSIEALDVSQLPKEGFTTLTVQDGPGTWSFAPNASVKQEFSWNVKRNPGYYTLFKVRFFERSSDGSVGNEIASHYIFGPTCQVAAKESGSPQDQ
jgi:hypothetical protein